ncbi:MAG: hypothetical protein KAJ20_02070 [Candidatus Aenigmarchaeota archaeon]|nr:hypothetical protein [Candidatus Aenigmarchaeota archaeon]
MDSMSSDVNASINEFIKLGSIHLVLPLKPSYNGVNKEAIGRINYRPDGSFVNIDKGTLYIKQVNDVDGGRIENLENYTFSGSLKVRLSRDDTLDVLYMEILENPSIGELKEGLLLQVELMGLS